MRLRHLIALITILTASTALSAPAGAATAESARAASAEAARLSAARLACSVASTSSCAPGRTIVRWNRSFHCTRRLARYGRLPLKVVVRFSRGRRFGGNGAIDLDTGCAGDGNPSTIDLIVLVRGNGRTYGPGRDAFKVRQRAGYNGGIQLTGHVDCGPRYVGAHQDGVQLQGGRNITFVDFSVGRYHRGRSTCHGAGGAFFYSGASGFRPQNIDVVRGRYIACTHSLFTGSGSGRVVGAKFRSGRTDGSDRKCRGVHGAPPCELETRRVRVSNIVCLRWNGRRNRWVRSRPG